MKNHRNYYPILIILILFNLSPKTFSQVYVHDISLDSIEKQINSNPDYLITLNQKCIYPDSVLTTPDYFELYYGSAYLEGYSPYSERTSAVAAYELLKQEMFEDAIALCETQINSNPGFVRPFYFLGIAYERLGDTVTAQKFYNRFYEFLSIPYFSGNGNSADSAFVVRSIDDEYLIIGELGLQSESQSLVFEDNIPFDILYVKTESDTLSHEMYFNIAQPYLLGLNFLEKNKKSAKKDKKKKRRKKNK